MKCSQRSVKGKSEVKDSVENMLPCMKEGKKRHSKDIYRSTWKHRLLLGGGPGQQELRVGGLALCPFVPFEFCVM